MPTSRRSAAHHRSVPPADALDTGRQPVPEEALLANFRGETAEGMNIVVVPKAEAGTAITKKVEIAFLEKMRKVASDMQPGLKILPLGLDERTLRAVLTTSRSIRAAQVAAAAAQETLSPQLARAVQSTENAWRRIERDHGLLTSGEVAEQLGSVAKNQSEYAAAKRKQGKLIGVQRGGAILHPGFQFENGKIHAVVPELISSAAALDLPLDELVQWLCAPHEAFDDDLPVQHLDDAVVLLEALEDDFGATW